MGTDGPTQTPREEPERLPPLELIDYRGRRVALAELWAAGPLVVALLRGFA